MWFGLKNQRYRDILDGLLALLQIYPPYHGGIHGAEGRREACGVFVPGLVAQGYRVLAHIHGLAPQHGKKPLWAFGGYNRELIFRALGTLAQFTEGCLPVSGRVRPAAWPLCQEITPGRDPRGILAVVGVSKHGPAEQYQGNKPHDQSCHCNSA